MIRVETETNDSIGKSEHEKIMLRRVRQLANSWLDVVPDFEQTIDVDSVEDVLVRARVLPSHNSYEERTTIIKNYGIKAHDGRVYFLDILFLVVIKPFARFVPSWKIITSLFAFLFKSEVPDLTYHLHATKLP